MTVTSGRSIQNLALVAENQVRVRDLLGFRKSHKVPEDYNERTQNFIWKIANENLNADLDQRFADFRKHFRFRRIDLQVQDPDNGCGLISTPLFDYRITVQQNETDLTAAVLRRQVSEFRDVEPLLSSTFATVFGNLFDTVEFEPPVPIDMEQFIDAMEAKEDNVTSIEFDRTATWCELVVDRIPGRLYVESDCISVLCGRPDLPARLLEAFFNYRECLRGIECF